MSKSSDFIIEDGVLTEYCGDDTKIVIPEGVTSIDDGVFWGEDSLLSISLPQGLKNIGEATFFCCAGLSEIVIPESVTSIGKGAFSECNGLKSISLGKGITTIDESIFKGCCSVDEVVIPEGVESIEDNAFLNCNGLKSITLPSSLKKIGNYAFSDCENLVQLTGGENIESIGNGAFNKTPLLLNECLVIGHVLIKYNGISKEVRIPEGIYSIFDEAFEGCSSAESIALPDGLISIGNSSFRECTGLKSINIPGSVKHIGEGAFFSCYSLKSIILPEGLTSIEANTFYRCNALENVQVPDTLMNIGLAAFSGTPWLEKAEFVLVADYLLKHNGSEENVIVPDGVKKVALQAFSGCTTMKTLTLPEGVEVLEGDPTGTRTSFFGCSKLVKVTIPNTLKEIGAAVFKDCTALEEINFPENLVHIGWQAFYRCYSLKFVDIASSHCKIDGYAFADTGVETLRVPAEERIDNYAFDNCQKLKSITITTGIQDDVFFIIRKGKALEKVYAPHIKLKNFDQLKTEAILGFVELYLRGEKIEKEIEQSYKNYIKTQRKKLYSIAVKDGNLLTYMISQNLIPLDQLDDVLAFSKDYPEATALLLSYKNQLLTPKVKKQLEKKEEKKIVKELSGAPMTVQEAKKIWDFYKEEDGSIILTLYKGDDRSIVVPSIIGKNTVIGIAKGTFDKVNIKEIEIPDSVTKIESQTFRLHKELANKDGLIIIKNVLYGCSGYSFYGGKEGPIEIPDGVTRIDDLAFYQCNITDVSIPPCVKEIGHRAFSGCSKLADENGLVIVRDTVYGYYGLNKKVVIPDTINYIEDEAFANNKGISEIILPNNIKYIGRQAFWGCSGLANKNGMIIVKDILFGYCGNQKDPVISEGITEIGDYAFSENKKIERIQIPNGVTRIGTGAFMECKKLRSVTIPDSVVYIGAEAFAEAGSLDTINIPKKIRFIEPRTFIGCRMLRKLRLPSGVQSIGEEAFQKDHIQISIPKTVIKIGSRAFSSFNVWIYADPDSYAGQYAIKHYGSVLTKWI